MNHTSVAPETLLQISTDIPIDIYNSVYLCVSGADEHQRTSFVLLECVDFYMMQKRGENAEDVIRSIIYSKTGGEVIAMRLFERQEAVAVMLTNEVATDVL